VRCRAQVWLRWRQDVRPGALRDGAGVLGPLGGACEARRAVPLRARLAGLQPETLELSDSADMDRRDATARLLRLQRRQHAQPMLRVQQPPTYLLTLLLPSSTAAGYCDARVCRCVCLSVCLSASMSQGLHVISLLIFACYQWLAPSPVALRYVMYYTSGVLNDVIFAHYRQNMQRENGRSSGSSMRSRAQTDIHER